MKMCSKKWEKENYNIIIFFPLTLFFIKKKTLKKNFLHSILFGKDEISISQLMFTEISFPANRNIGVWMANQKSIQPKLELILEYQSIDVVRKDLIQWFLNKNVSSTNGIQMIWIAHVG